MSQINILVEICREDPDIKLPTYARHGDAGMDVRSAITIKIEPGETTVIPTGLKVAIPIGYEIQVRPKSGISLKTGLRVANAPGTIDAGYRDEIGVIITNISSKYILINKGDRIAQLVLSEVPTINWIPVNNVATIGQNRGGGFGSTNVK